MNVISISMSLFKNPFWRTPDQSQTLPAAFDKADKDAFVADCKEVVIIIIIIIISIIIVVIIVSKFPIFLVSKNLLLPNRYQEYKFHPTWKRQKEPKLTDKHNKVLFGWISSW